MFTENIYRYKNKTSPRDLHSSVREKPQLEIEVGKDGVFLLKSFTATPKTLEINSLSLFENAFCNIFDTAKVNVKYTYTSERGSNEFVDRLWKQIFRSECF